MVAKRHVLSVIAVIALLGACSDDTQQPRPDLRTTDIAKGVDATKEARSSDGKAADQRRADGPGAPAYSATLILSELVGPPMKPGDPPTKLAMTSAFFETPDPKIKPDYADPKSPLPPSCIVYKWTKTTPPNRTNGDAGKVTFKGYTPAQYVDGDNPGAPVQMPASLECTRKELAPGAGLYQYECPLPGTAVLLSSWITDSSAIDFEVTGGKDVGAFSEKGIAPSPTALPKSTFDMNNIDPANVKIEWQPVQASVMVFVMYASLADGSEFAQVECTLMAAAGSHTVPAAALALLPKPTTTKPLNIFSMLFSMNPKGSKQTWGDYMVAASRGTWGSSCRTPSGPCPAP